MKKFVLAGVLLFASSLTFAGSSSGCGLGNLILKGQSGMIFNVMAVTTNGTLWTQTFGMTSGTSGCNANDVVLQEKEAEVFIASNYNRIQEDVSQGNGEYVASLGKIMGCESSAFATSMQGKVEYVFETADAQQVIKNTKSVIAADPVLAKSCIQ